MNGDDKSILGKFKKGFCLSKKKKLKFLYFSLP